MYRADTIQQEAVREWENYYARKRANARSLLYIDNLKKVLQESANTVHTHTYIHVVMHITIHTYHNSHIMAVCTQNFLRKTSAISVASQEEA